MYSVSAAKAAGYSSDITDVKKTDLVFGWLTLGLFVFLSIRKSDTRQINNIFLNSMLCLYLQGTQIKSDHGCF